MVRGNQIALTEMAIDIGHPESFSTCILEACTGNTLLTLNPIATSSWRIVKTGQPMDKMSTSAELWTLHTKGVSQCVRLKGEPRLLPTAMVSDGMLSAPAPPLHCTSITLSLSSLELCLLHGVGFENRRFRVMEWGGASRDLVWWRFDGWWAARPRGREGRRGEGSSPATNTMSFCNSLICFCSLSQ